MHEPTSWSIGLGRWAGVPVRVHMFFLFAAALVIQVACLSGLGVPVQQTLAWAAFGVSVLLMSVLVHEWAHWRVALHLGGGAAQIVIGPLGGLEPMETSHKPRSDVLIALAGPLANLALGLLAAVALAAANETARLSELFNILRPPLEDATWVTYLAIVFWVNWLLVVINVLPVVPFDGGYALRALLAAWFPDQGPVRAAAVTTYMARMFAGALVLVAGWLLIREALRMQPQSVEPISSSWFALVLLAIYIYFAAGTVAASVSPPSPADDAVFGYDFSQGYTSLNRSTERSVPRPSRRFRLLTWWRDAMRRRRERCEAHDEERVDEILSRLHSLGSSSLSAADRGVLARVSARYRNRLAKPGVSDES